MCWLVPKYDSVYDIPEAERPRYEELNRIMAAFDEGITAGYEIKGTSAIGEGLASCLFSFPELNTEDRTRLILFLTDNHEELLDAPLVTLSDAAEMCAVDNVAVFGIYHGSGAEDEAAQVEKEEMQAAVEQTMGQFYDSGGSLTAEEILEDIRSRETALTNTATSVKNEDEPGIWIPILAAGVALLTIVTLYSIIDSYSAAGRDDCGRGHGLVPPQVSQLQYRYHHQQSGRGPCGGYYDQHVGGRPRQGDPHGRREEGYRPYHE